MLDSRLIASVLSGIAHRLRHAAAELPEPQADRMKCVVCLVEDANIELGQILDELGRCAA